MCHGPHLGSLWALLGINFGYNYRNLFPLWPCVQSVTLTRKSPFIFLPMPSYNTELSDLNSQLLPLDTTYEIVYSTSVPTPYTKSIVRVPGHKPGTIINYTAGDIIVPDFSQRGLLQNPNFPDAPLFRIPAFQSIIGKITEKEIDGSHVTGYMNSEAIGEEVFNQFIGDFQS